MELNCFVILFEWWKSWTLTPNPWIMVFCHRPFPRPPADCCGPVEPCRVGRGLTSSLQSRLWSRLWSDLPEKCELSPLLSQLPSVDFSQKHASIHREQIKGKKGFRGLEHAPGAPLAGECEVGVRLISSAHERLAPVCLAATSLSVCFISACQALSELLVLLLLLASGSGTAHLHRTGNTSTLLFIICSNSTACAADQFMLECLETSVKDSELM